MHSISSRLILYSIIFLIFFDFLFFKVEIYFLHITALRAILLIGFILLILFQLKRKYIKLSTSKFVNFVLLFFIFWIIYSFVQLLWVIDLNEATKAIYYLVFYFILLYVIINLNDKNNFIKADKLLYLIGVILILFGIIEIFFNVHLPTSRLFKEEMSIQNMNKATAVFYNENDFSMFLVLLFPFFLINLLENQKANKFFSIFMLILTFYIVIANEARLALFSLLLQIISIIFFNINKRRGIIIIFLVAVIISMLSFYLIEDIIEELKTEFNLTGASASVRLDLIRKGFELLLGSYLLGVGPGNFEANIIKVTNGAGIYGIINSHNWWIELMTNYGLIIFSLYLFIFIKMLINLYHIGKDTDKTYSYYGKVFFISFIGFILSSGGPGSIFYKWFHWMYFALAISLINIYSSKNIKGNKSNTIS